MTIFLDFFEGFASKIKSLVLWISGLFVLFFIAYAHQKIGPVMIYNHKFLISMAPTLAGICFLYFGYFINKLEGKK